VILRAKFRTKATAGPAVAFIRLGTYIRLFPRTGGSSLSSRFQPERSSVDHNDVVATPATPPAGTPAPGSSDVELMMPLVYEELRRIARRQLRHEGVGHTLNTTALVHEAYLRLAAPSHLDVSGRAEFLSIAAMAMRRVLIDYARQRTAQKRGGVQMRVELDDIEVAADDRAEQLVALDEALTALAASNPRLARVVDCRFFGGMSQEETAIALQLTPRTVRRDWTKARMWLAVAMDAEPS
jgi:RNA polymerase sigma factor (TIGR02999 family)